jgi:hypothetical protein
MATYQIETNQGTFEIDADREPTPQDIEAYMASRDSMANQAPADVPLSMIPVPTPWGGKFNPIEAAQTVKNMGLEAGGAAGGQALGVGTGPLAPVAVPALGAVGGFLGNVAGQLTTPGKDFSWGEAGGAFVAGSVPGASLAKAGGKVLVKEGLKAAATNYGAKATETLIDRGELPSAGEAMMATGAGAVAPVIGKVSGKAMGSPETAINRGVQADIYDSIAEMQKLGVKDGRGRVIKSVVVDPGSVHDKTPSAAKLFAGRAALNQEASVMNADAINAAAREAIGLSAEARPLSRETIKAVINEAYEPYSKIQAIQKQAKAQLATLEKQALTEASGHGAQLQMDSPEFHRMADPLRVQAAADVDQLKLSRINAHREMEKIHAQAPDASYDKFRAYKDEAEAISDAIEKAAELSGDKDLLKRLKASRVRIASSYNLMNAVSLNGIVDARKLASQMEHGAPLSGNLQKLARFADAVSKDVIPINRAGDPNINQLTGQIGFGATAVNPSTGVLALGMPFVGRKARERLLADEFQRNMFATKRENPVNRFMENLGRLGTMTAGRSVFLPEPVEGR